MKVKKSAFSFDIEVTARCNLDCRHCYINLPAGDKAAEKKELTLEEIDRFGSEAVSLEAVWCLVTGGEPLLRKDFFDIYMILRRKGLLVSLYTNANLITPEHIEFFKKHPPRDIEVTVYGVTEETYEQVTRRPGSFRAFMRGLELLRESGVKVRLKAMALRSNVHELQKIADFCRNGTKDYFRFDPFLHYRFDRDAARNRDIEAERLSPKEIVSLERADLERFNALVTSCDDLVIRHTSDADCDHLFRCGAGRRNFIIGHDGKFKLCVSLTHPDCIYDLRKGSVVDAWSRFVPEILAMRTKRREYLERCGKCPIINLCLWCPAHAYLETGELDAPVDVFCEAAHARERALREGQQRDLELVKHKSEESA
jgi:radical SAM protein with 4Fe4S-binding SPASM domain